MQHTNKRKWNEHLIISTSVIILIFGIVSLVANIKSGEYKQFNIAVMLLLDFSVQSATGLLRMPLELTISCVIFFGSNIPTQQTGSFPWANKPGLRVLNSYWVAQDG